jgi:hypothetical protein
LTKARDNANGGFGLVLMKPSTVVNGTDNGKGTVSFSAATSVSLNDVFSSTYDHYRVVLDAVGLDVDFRFRLRASGSDNTTSNYWFGGYYIPYGAGPSVTATSGGGAASSFTFSSVSSGAGSYYFDITWLFILS